MAPLFLNAQSNPLIPGHVSAEISRQYNNKYIDTEKPSATDSSHNGLNSLILLKENLGIVFSSVKKNLHSKQSDSLIVGAVPGDSLIITGNFTHNGPIIVWGDGILRFKNANASVYGDIYVWGETATLTIDSSYIYCPQQFFYQRNLVAAGGGKIKVTNSTLDYGGLSHSLLATDSAYVEMDSVHNIGFTTNGVYEKSSIKISRTNQAGEYVITDFSNLNFDDANTVLLWHQIPAGAVFNMDFPANNNVAHYELNNTTPGISGINYIINLDNCTDVMWALMPSSGSDVSISNSEIRAIGLWFTGSDTVEVNGFVNNSDYTNFTAGLSDRNLNLVNTSVQTWSLYTFEQAAIKVSGCIVGEIGAMEQSYVKATNIYVDGSGGYYFCNDASFVISVNTNTTSSLRTAGNSILLYAYSTLSNGQLLALDNSVMVVLQSLIPEDPIALDAACTWLVNLETPYSVYTDTLVSLNGSAWIDKTPVSQLMDFSYYQLFYQFDGDTTWNAITPKITQEKYHEPLALWNTHGLQAGSYVLKLLVADNFPDTNKMEALKSITLLPAFLNMEESRNDDLFAFYPNPVEGSFTFVNNSGGEVELSIMDIYGRVIKNFLLFNEISLIDIGYFSAGIYNLTVKQNNRTDVFKIVKK